MGDITFNSELELHDAILIFKACLPDGPKFDRDDEEFVVGDYNVDGSVGVYDSIEIIKTLIASPSVPSSENNEFVEISGAGIEIGNVKATIGEDSTIEVPLMLTGDISSYGCLIEINYDEELTLTDRYGLTILDEETGRAVYASGTEMKTRFGSLTFECPDTAGEYSVDVNIYALDYNGESYVSNPVATSGTITVASAEPAYDYLTYEKIDEDEDGTYDYVTITDCDESVTEVVIPSEIEGLPVESLGKIEDDGYSIGTGTFCGCVNLKSVTIPDSVNIIRNGVFNDCTSLESIVIPDKVTSIGLMAFAGCTSLENVVFGDSLESIDGMAFACCESIKNITLPESVTLICQDSFASCTNLESVVLPYGVTSVGIYAFWGCENLKSVTIENPDCKIPYEGFDVSYEPSVFPTTTTIYGYWGSTAHDYALKYDREFVSLDEPRGDISGNGSIDLYDAIEIAKFMIGSREFSEEEIAIADFDGDGVVGLYDAIGIAKYMLNN